MDKSGSHYNKRTKSDRGRSKVYGSIYYMWDLKEREREKCQNHRNRGLEGWFPAAEERVTGGMLLP